MVLSTEKKKTNKTAQRKRCELCFIQSLTKDCNSGDSLSVVLKNCSKDTGDEPVYVWVIVVRKSIWSNVHLDKRWPLITKNMYLKLMMLFEYVVLHHLLAFAQTHVHWVGDAIQPSHPLSSPSPSALNLSQHQSLFQWVSSSHQVAKVLELQHQSFQRIFRKMQESRVIEILSEIYIKLAMGPFPNGQSPVLFFPSSIPLRDTVPGLWLYPLYNWVMSDTLFIFSSQF